MTTLVSVIVCGSRDGAPAGVVERGMALAFDQLAFTHVVVGSRYRSRKTGVASVDLRAFTWAEHHELVATVVNAKWNTGLAGKGEGPIRNRRMLALFPGAIAVLAFPGGTGTADMMRASRDAGVKRLQWVDDAWRVGS